MPDIELNQLVYPVLLLAFCQFALRFGIRELRNGIRAVSTKKIPQGNKWWQRFDDQEAESAGKHMIRVSILMLVLGSLAIFEAVRYLIELAF